ncbi:hypothetical protein FRY74_03230 [Vicingus serpentipes]|jgi:hypothetical protein|uniref:DUF3575 domain-containing protein n=1 Tax=Vicingus serpentipes TaxID=1926625 RepID=A0A5C6S0T2_9FLAO|nr:hypothetical protein [Vicingus serpentipes]TXB67212.1 hypothetical protein FRY74_03230 [Vicingus serpentipes]
MKFIRLYFFILLSFFSLQYYSQSNEQVGVFEEDFRTSFKIKPKLDVKLDTRFSFIAASDIRTTGVKLGLSFNREFKMGLGYNRLISPSKSFIQKDDVNYKADLYYEYLSPYLEYIYHNSKKWEFNIAIQFGIGRGYYQFYNSLTDSKEKTNHSFILSYEPSMLIDYKIVRWVGIGSGIGYRLILYKNKNISEHLTSPVFIFKAKIYLGEIVRTITGKEIQAE